MSIKRTWGAIALALTLLMAGGLAAEKPETKSEKQKAALASLETLEKALPAERSPSAAMDETEKDKRAEAFFKAGIACHDLMQTYAESLGKKADQFLRASLAYRESPLTRVYLGSSHLIQARDVSSVFAKVNEVDVGLKEVDAAVKAAPEDILTRAIRVECTIELPAMFKRLDTVTSDLNFLLKAYSESPQTFADAYSPARLFELKVKELELRGKGSMTDKYREKAEELSKGEKK